MVVCHRVCDYHHEHLEEEERLTTMVTTTGALAQGEGCHYDTMTGSTAMVTTMQDRLQERLSTKRPTTSLDYVIRLTDRLRSKIYTFFSHKIPKIRKRGFRSQKPPFPTTPEKGAPSQKVPISMQSITRKMGIF